MSKRRSQIDIDIPSLDASQLRQALRQYTKTANSRLKTLGSSQVRKSSKAYQYVEKYYERGVDTVKKDRSGNLKFNTDFRKMSKRQLESELKQVRDFLNAKTSTVKGVQSAYRQAYETYKQKTKEATGQSLKMSYKEWSEFWDNASVRQFMNMYGNKGSGIADNVVSSYGDELTPEQIIEVFVKEVERMKATHEIPEGTRHIFQALKEQKQKKDETATKKMKKFSQKQADALSKVFK